MNEGEKKICSGNKKKEPFLGGWLFLFYHESGMRSYLSMTLLLSLSQCFPGEGCPRIFFSV